MELGSLKNSGERLIKKDSTYRMVKTLKNIPLTIQGHSSHLTNLRAKSIKALKNWETAQKSRRRSRLKESQLQLTAAKALSKYANTIVEEEGKKTYIGTAQNMSGHTPLPMNERTVRLLQNNARRPRSKLRRNSFLNEANKGLNAVGLNENLNTMHKMRGGNSKKKTMKNKRR